MERLSKINQVLPEETDSVELTSTSPISIKDKPLDKTGGLSISNSALDKYNMCGKLYKYHYIDRIRSTRGSSALYFGSAVDEALNALLENKDQDGALQRALTIYNTEMSNWQHSYNTDFFKADADKRILNPEDVIDIDNTPEERQEHAFAWFSLLRKGYVFIRRYSEEILPKIKEVKSVQEKISKRNQHDDEIVGYLDLVGIWNNPSDPDNASICIIDNKTSSSSYAKSKIENSRQLNLYAWALGLDDISYIVMRKDMDAKGQIRPIQILHGKRNDDIIEEVLGDIDRVLTSVKNNDFPETKQKWNCTKQFGRKCIYFDMCKNNKELTECSNLKKLK